jgi:anti-anti-sigma factor
LPEGRGVDLLGVESMQIRKNITGDEHELLVAGRIDGDGAHQLELEILQAIKSGAKSVYVNLGEATFLCSAGIRVLLQYWRQMKNTQKMLLVTRPSPEVNAALDMTGFKEALVEKI